MNLDEMTEYHDKVMEKVDRITGVFPEDISFDELMQWVNALLHVTSDLVVAAELRKQAVIDALNRYIEMLEHMKDDNKPERVH